MIKEIYAYDERDKIFKKNEIIIETYENNNQFDIMGCLLLKDKEIEEYSIFLTTNSDGRWLYMTFEDGK